MRWLGRALGAALAASLTMAAPALAAGPITSGQLVAGSVAGPSFGESWTFSGTAGDRVVIAATTTSGAMNTNITLRSPASVVVLNTTSDLSDFQLTATGTWTITIEDNGLNDAGSYNLSFLNVTAGPLTSGADPDGGAIASATSKNGQFNAIADLDAYTFTGTAGDRVVMSAIATGAGAHNTQIWLYPPGGGAIEDYTGADRLERQLSATGTYTVLVFDASLDDVGTYTLSFLNMTAGPITTAGDPDGGTILSAEIKTGQANGVGDFDVFRFTGTTGHRVVIGGPETGGVGFNTSLYLYPPGGGPPLSATTSNMFDAQLTATGTWTILVEDNGQTHTGTYSLAYLDVTSGPLTTAGDLDGGAIASADSKNAQFNAAADMDAYTFAGTAGDRVVMSAVATGAGAHNTQIWLYPPGGGTLEDYTGADRLERQLSATGTYTVLVFDAGLDDVGAYTMSFLNMTAGPITTAGDPDGGTILSAEIKTGQANGVGDFDVFRFTGTAGHRVVIAGVETAGVGFNTSLYLYPPGGGPSIFTTTSNQFDTLLPSSGTWTILVEDNGQTHTGSYSLAYLDVTGGPLTTAGDLDGGAIASADSKNGQFNAAADLDAYTFTGTAGDRVVMSAIATGAGAHNTQIWLYPPGGGTLEDYTGGDRLERQLSATGTYTVLVFDAGLDDVGTYTMSFLNMTAGPISTAGDPDGGTILSAEIKTGQANGVGDFDVFRFTGTTGHRVLIGSLEKTGVGFNTFVNLYPPGGGPAFFTTTSNLFDVLLTASGTWTILVEDNGQTHTGTYSVSYLDVTSGPFTTAGDLDGGAIASADSKNAQFNAAVDFDAYTFTGTAGDRVVMSAIATGAGTHNTQVYLYPPGGGALEDYTGGDRIDHQLAASGTYTVVVFDAGLEDTGTYTFSYLNLTAGPISTAGDPDGGTIVSAEIKSGQSNAIGDFDIYRFNGASGHRVMITGVETAGVGYNAYVYLYPPGGGQALFSTTSSLFDYALNATGTWTILVEDNGQTHTGSYNLSYVDLTAGPYTTATDLDGGPIASAQFKTGQFHAPGDVDAYTFTGYAGSRILAGAIATGAGTHNTQLYLYPPNGGALEDYSGGDRLDHQLAQSGTYTLVIFDAGLDETGTYALSLTDISLGPLVSASDPDSAILAKGNLRAGQITPAPDFDVYKFVGFAGDTAKITAVTTSGTLNTNCTLYPPNYGAAVSATSADNFNYVLPTSGRYTLVVEDATLTHTGGYNVSLAGAGATVDVPGPDATGGDRTRVVLEAVQPSPFRTGTRVAFSLPSAAPVRLEVYGVSGQRIRTLAAGTLAAGTHQLTWDGTDDAGRRAASGVYFVRLAALGADQRRRVVRLD